MENFVIATDSSCDSFNDEIEILNFRYTCKDNTYTDEMSTSKYKEFYKNMREGYTFKTSQLNTNYYYSFFKEILKRTNKIIFISLGSGLSNTINNAIEAKQILESENKNYKIEIIDSKLASLGLTMLVDIALEMKKNKKDYEEIIETLKEKVTEINTYYTTDTLKYFARGGRLSKVSACIGNTFKINPILDCNEAGNLHINKMIRGQKHAFEYIIEKIKETVINPSEQTLYLCHADNEEKIIELKDLIMKEVPFKDYKICFMGSTIGCHAGPGLLAIFYFGKKRN